MYQYSNHVDLIAKDHINRAHNDAELVRLSKSAKRKASGGRLPVLSATLATLSAMISMTLLHTPRS